MSQLGELAKIRRHAVENLQKQLQAVMVRLGQKEQEQAQLNAESARLAEPVCGILSELRVYDEKRRMYRSEIKAIEREIFQIHKQAFAIRHHLKLAHIEYEKISHMNKEALAAQALAVRKNESKILEEAAHNSRTVTQRHAQ